ncbi:glutamine synthetase [Pseudomaricurvus alcaniphilus]|uniref:glutamine synthetase family protein n=1 Tax=Pseudomaricurvus alcaniphilus TaxID=1166482 RepID=UPI00140D6567|nr:glutamine synthetase family protein [Pseudomaricurvus alcaniphilus]NHN38366.1 glutamine synthetase [Pseudomaricurvus alcaniphilus]
MHASSLSAADQAKQFLDKYPQVDTIEMILADINGVHRGKWLPRESLVNALQGSIKLPITTLCLDIWGRDVYELVFESGDADGLCLPVADSLALVPWAERPAAQMLVSMANLDGTPFAGDPRVVLQQVCDRYRGLGLRPVVAIELEFHLLQQPRAADGSPAHTGNQAERPLGGETYSLDLMEKYAAVFHEMRDAAALLGVAVDTLIKEGGPSQYEINLNHTDDPLVAADQALMLKRLIKKVAQKHDLVASFMAKPFADSAGNGMHVHFSLLNDAGANVYDNGSEAGSATLRHAIAGLADTMPDCMAIFAPNQNSYRRLQPGNHAPLSPCWGYENRTVALRVPAGDTSAMRIEHRVAGADANAYLTLAAILAGAYVGITEKRAAPEPTVGDAYSTHKPSLPAFWPEALRRFDASRFIAQQLNPTLQKMYSASKWQELNQFNNTVTSMEYDAYLNTV